MRISDWSSDVCSSDLDSPPTSAPTRSGGATLPTDFGVALGDAGFLAMMISSSVGVGTGRTAGIAPGTQPPRGGGHEGRTHRSEEHTSELQSLMRISYAVFCLKKKKNRTRINEYINK